MMNILEIKDLTVQIKNKNSLLTIADRISFDVKKNEIVGIVGESGCGKTMTALALTHLLPKNAICRCLEYHFEQHRVDFSNEKDIEKLRAKGISYIFQEPSSYLDPLFCVGDQIKECFKYNSKYVDKKAVEQSIVQLERVGLYPGNEFYHYFPHQLSGGMNQRVMIAMAISCGSKILIADEPTTALDVATEQSIVALIRKLVKETDLSVIWITHDISLIQSFADRIAVMYAGRIVEIGSCAQIYNTPAHPYTKALMQCLPEKLTENKFITIAGEVPHLSQLPTGCKFNPRCAQRLEKCIYSEPDFVTIAEGQKAKCFLL